MLGRIIIRSNRYNSNVAKKFINSPLIEPSILDSVTRKNVEEIRKIKSEFMEGGGSRGRTALKKQGKMFVDDKLSRLFDDGKFIEIGLLIGYGQKYGNIPRAGCVTGFGKINNRQCAFIASDSTVKAGTVYPIQLRKQLRLFDLAEKLKVPLVFIIDSGGAFLPLQAEIFADKEYGGRIFYNEAYFQSLGLDVLTLVCGSCTAGGAYIPTMSSEAGMVTGIGHIFLGGPPLVKAAIGEVLSAEELGGATLHTTVSGSADYKYESEQEGIDSIRCIVSTLPQQTLVLMHRDLPVVSPFYKPDELNTIFINQPNLTTSQKRDNMLKIVSRILDSSSLHEYKKSYGQGSITGYAKVNGYTVGVISIYGELDEKDCLKCSNFIQICDSRQIHLISLLHLSSKCGSGDAKEDAVILSSKASVIRSLATRQVSLITLFVGDCFGSDYYVFGGESVKSEVILAWPNARFSHELSDDIDKYQENDMDGTSNYHSALKVAGNMVVDSVIEPSDTRKVLSEYLEIFNIDSSSRASDATSYNPVYRF